MSRETVAPFTTTRPRTVPPPLPSPPESRVRRVLSRHGVRRREVAAQLLLLGVARVRRGGGRAVAVLQLLRLLCEEVAQARHLTTSSIHLNSQIGGISLGDLSCALKVQRLPLCDCKICN